MYWEDCAYQWNIRFTVGQTVKADVRINPAKLIIPVAKYFSMEVKNMKTSIKRISKRTIAIILSVLMVVTSFAFGTITASATNSVNGGYIYFDNSKTSWTDSSIQFVIGHSTYSRTYVMTQVSGTKLYYVNLGSQTYSTWNDATYYAFIGSSSKWGDGGWGPDNTTNATHYTGTYTSAYNTTTTGTYLFTPSGSSNGTSITPSYQSSYSGLNYTQTGSVYTDAGSGYTSSAAGGTVNLSGYYMSGNGTSGSSSTTSTSSASTATYNAANTSNMTMTATPASGYNFIGWYDSTSSSATALGTNSTYSYTVSGTKTVYARFQIASVSASVAASYSTDGSTYTNGIIGGSAYVGTSANPTSADTLTGLTVGTTVYTKATAAEGYTFLGWYNGSTQVSTDTAYSYAISATTSLTAKFAANRTVSFSASPADKGTAVAAVGGTAIESGATVQAGKAVTLTAAVTDDTYKFSAWTISGDYTISSGSLTSNSITIAPTTSNVTATATFVQKSTYTAAAEVNDSTKGSAYVTPSSVTEGNTVTYSATVNDGYAFTNWTVTSGTYEISSGSLTSASLTIIPTSDVTLKANFSDGTRRVYLATQTSWSGEWSPTRAYGNNGTTYTGTQIGTSSYTYNNVNYYVYTVDLPAAVTSFQFQNSGTYKDTATNTVVANQLYYLSGNGSVSTVTAPSFSTFTANGEASALSIKATNQVTFASTLSKSTSVIGSPLTTIYKVNGTAISGSTWTPTEPGTYTAVSYIHDSLKGGTTTGTVTDIKSSSITITVLPNTVNLTSNVKYSDDGTTWTDDTTNTVATAGISTTSEGTYSSTLTADSGATVYFKATDNSSGVYAFLGWYNGDTLVSSDNPYSTSYTDDATLTARYIKKYSVTTSVSDGTKGTISADPSATSVNAGTSVTFTAALTDSTYKLDHWLVNGTAQAAAGNTLTLSITANTTVQAVFAAKASYILTFTAGENGNLTATVNGAQASTGQTIYEGDSVVLTETPNTGYKLSALTVNGTSVTPTNKKYTIASASGNITASAAFEASKEGTLYFKATTDYTSLNAALDGDTVAMTKIATKDGGYLWTCVYNGTGTLAVSDGGSFTQNVAVTEGSTLFAAQGSAEVTTWAPLAATLSVVSATRYANTTYDLTAIAPVTVTGSLSGTKTVAYYVNGTLVSNPSSWTPASSANYTVYATVTDGFTAVNGDTTVSHSTTTNSGSIKVLGQNIFPSDTTKGRILLDISKTSNDTSAWTQPYVFLNNYTAEAVKNTTANSTGYAMSQITINGTTYWYYDVPTSTSYDHVLFSAYSTAINDGDNWKQSKNVSINKSAWTDGDASLQVYQLNSDYNATNINGFGSTTTKLHGIATTTIAAPTDPDLYTVKIFAGYDATVASNGYALASLSVTGAATGTVSGNTTLAYYKDTVASTITVTATGVTSGYDVTFVTDNNEVYPTTVTENGSIATIPVSKDTVIVAVYQPTSNYKTIYAEMDTNSSDSLVTKNFLGYYAWHTSGTAAAKTNIYPGQPMIPTITKAGQYVIKVPNTTEGVTFNSYTYSLNPNTSSTTAALGLTGKNLQSYDTYDFAALSADYDILTYQLKPNTRSQSGARSVHRLDTNLKGQPIDVFGNILKKDDGTEYQASDYQTLLESVYDGGVSGTLYDYREYYNAGTGFEYATRDNFYAYSASYGDANKPSATAITQIDNTTTRATALTALAAYANKPLLVNYEATLGWTSGNQPTSNGDPDSTAAATTRTDGKWYYDKIVYRTVNLATKFGSFNESGTFVEDTSKTNYGTAYFTGSTDTTRTVLDGTDLNTTAAVTDATNTTKFVGWYNEAGTNISSDYNYGFNATADMTLYAYFTPKASNEVIVSHQIYSSDTDPISHGGTARLTMTDTDNVAISTVSILEGGSKNVRITTTPDGVDKFYTWYVQKTYADGTKSTLEEITNSYKDSTGTLSHDYTINYEANLSAVTFYSDIQLVSKIVKIKYLYNDRNGTQQQYVVPNVTATYDSASGKYYIPASYVTEHAPYVNDLYKDSTWKNISENQYTFVYTAQTNNVFTVTANYRDTSGNLESGQNANGVYNGLTYDSVHFTSAESYNDAGTTKYFLYWEDAAHQKMSYYSNYWYRFYWHKGVKSAEVTAVYGTAAEKAALANEVYLDQAVYERVQTTDDDGKLLTDKIRTNYLVSLLLPAHAIPTTAKFGVVIAKDGVTPSTTEFNTSTGVWTPSTTSNKVLQKECSTYTITNKERFNYYVTLTNDTKYYGNYNVYAYYIDNGNVILSNLQNLNIQGAGTSTDASRAANIPQITVQ